MGGQKQKKLPQQRRRYQRRFWRLLQHRVKHPQPQVEPPQQQVKPPQQRRR